MRKPTSIEAIGRSTRDKSFVTAGHDGSLVLRHVTSERTLLEFPAIGQPVVLRKASRLILVGNVRVPQVGGKVEKTAAGARISVDSRDATGLVLQCLVAAGVQTIRTSVPSLDEVYVHVFGDRGLRI